MKHRQATIRVTTLGLLVMVAFLISWGIAAGQAPTTPPPKALSPSDGHALDWIRDARWYHVVVPRFRNGDASNDPPATRAWSAAWPVAEVPSAAETKQGGAPAARPWQGQSYGGDLPGLRQKLTYLKQLGVNALILSSVLHGTAEQPRDAIDLRHVDDSLAVANSLEALTGKSAQPASSKLSASDRMLFDFLGEAHRQGFRVVLEGSLRDVGPTIKTAGDRERYALAIARRWMDADQNGDPSDGIDGWMLTSPLGFDALFWKKWRTQVRAINPSAVIIGDVSEAVERSTPGLFDLTFNDRLSAGILHFFSDPTDARTMETFLGQLSLSRKGIDLFDKVAKHGHSPGPKPAARNTAADKTPVGLGETRSFSPHAASLTRLTAPHGRRALTALAKRFQKGDDLAAGSTGGAPDDDALDRWRLAVVLSHFLPGAPVTFHGDEVGMYGDVRAGAPMWWDDLASSAGRPIPIRWDLAALIRRLHKLRGDLAPLRRGDFSVVPIEVTHVLAIARALPGDKVILVMNYGSDAQEVSIPAGPVKKLVTVLSPELRARAPSTRGLQSIPPGGAGKAPRLRMGGYRQYTDRTGSISLELTPRSIRIVLVGKAQQAKRR